MASLITADSPSSIQYPSGQNAVSTMDWDKLKEKATGMAGESARRDYCCSSPPLERIVPNNPQSGQGFESHQFDEFRTKKLKPDNEGFESTMMMSVNRKQEADNEYSAFARHVTFQLRHMTNVQKLLAQRLISEVCFQGQMQCLQIGTTLTGHTAPVQHLTLQQSMPVFKVKPLPFRVDATTRVDVLKQTNSAPIPTYYHHLPNIPQQQDNHVPATTRSSIHNTCLDDKV